MSESIKFHRVFGLPNSGTTGHVYFDIDTKGIYLYNGSNFEPYTGDIVTELDDDCTDLEIPSAKCVYDTIADNEEVTAAALNTLNSGKISEPSTEGTSGMVLATDGAGGRTWVSVQSVSGSSTSWGNISGTLSSQTDLQDALDDKLDTSEQNVKSAGVEDQTLTITNHDGTTVSLTNTTYSDASTLVHGLMSASDKSKLDGIVAGANLVTESTVAGWGFTKNVGTITGITMNNTTMGTSGNVDLGTVITSHQDISGKEDKTNKVTSISSDSTDTQYPSAKCVYDAFGNKIVSQSLTSVEISPNVMNLWSSAMTELTITLGAPTDVNRVNEYMIQFTSDSSTAATFTYPSAITWAESNATTIVDGVVIPEIKAGKTYQISIINNFGIIGEF